MPARQPFTVVCRGLSQRRPQVGRADLHVHTTHSDGDYSPANIVDLARRAGLAALAITDHDSTNGVADAQAAASSVPLEIISGVEISAEFEGRDFHLLGYFVNIDDTPLQAELSRLREHRQARFWEIAKRLENCGVRLDPNVLKQQSVSGSVGRRHFANLLVETRQAGSVREAFARYLHEGGRADVPKMRLSVAEAIALVHGAGGVAAWAHPPYDTLQRHGAALKGLGLDAIEVEYPNRRPTTIRCYRALAAHWGFAITGGSDYHGPERTKHGIGSCTISDAELAALRSLVRG